MINLIIKDILIQKKTVLISMMYVVFCMFTFQNMGSSSIDVGIIAVTYMLITTASFYEDKNRADVMLNSLPISRAKIVLSKYLSVFVYAVMGVISYIIAVLIIKGLSIPIKLYPVTTEVIIGLIFAIVLLNSMYLPLFFKFGYTKAKAINFVLFFAYFFGIFTLSDYLKKNVNNPVISNLVNFFTNSTDFEVALIFISLIAAILLISTSLSLKFYKNREF